MVCAIRWDNVEGVKSAPMVKCSQGTHPGMGFRGNILGNKEKDGCGREYLRIGLNGVPEEIIFAKGYTGST